MSSGSFPRIFIVERFVCVRIYATALDSSGIARLAIIIFFALSCALPRLASVSLLSPQFAVQSVDFCLHLLLMYVNMNLLSKIR